MSTFAYTVGIKLTVANLASRVIRVLANDLLFAQGRATALGDKLTALKFIAAGWGMEKAGHGILGFMGKAIDASKEYTAQLSLMNAAGMSQVEIARATAAAWSTSRNVVTSSAAENLKAIRELRSVFGNKNMGEAYAILPTVQRTKGILEALTGRAQEGVAFDMVKAIELRTPGLMTSGGMQRNADMMAQTLMAMGGTLNAHDFHMVLKQAKTAGFGWSDDFVYKYLPTLMQEVKTGHSGSSSTAGTALMSTYAAVVQGIIKKSAIPVWESLGLIGAGDVVKNSTGSLQLKPGAVRGAQLFQQNPYAWANQVLAPAIAKYGAEHGLNREQVISAMFGNRNAQWTVNTLIAKAAQFERDKTLIQSGGNSYSTYQKLLKSNPELAEQAYQKQWQNVLAILGYQVLPVLLPLMVKFASGLNNIAQFMERHPNMTRAIGFGLIGLGAALTILGKALMTYGIIRFLGMGSMFTAAFTGVRVAGLLVVRVLGWWVTAALAVWINWREISSSLKAIWNDMKVTVIRTFSGDILGALKTFGHAIVLGFQVIFNTIIAGVNSILPAAMAIGKFHFADANGNGGSAAFAPHKVSVQHNHFYVDGKEVAIATANRIPPLLAKQAAKPSAGPSMFDTSRAPLRPSMVVR